MIKLEYKNGFNETIFQDWIKLFDFYPLLEFTLEFRKNPIISMTENCQLKIALKENLENILEGLSHDYRVCIIDDYYVIKYKEKELNTNDIIIGLSYYKNDMYELTYKIIRS